MRFKPIISLPLSLPSSLSLSLPLLLPLTPSPTPSPSPTGTVRRHAATPRQELPDEPESVVSYPCVYVCAHVSVWVCVRACVLDRAAVRNSTHAICCSAASRADDQAAFRIWRRRACRNPGHFQIQGRRYHFKNIIINYEKCYGIYGHKDLEAFLPPPCR
jgi:hypothetical protein